jgi:hypothetical protein
MQQTVTKGKGSYDTRTLTLASGTEYDSYRRAFPSTDDLPSTHEHYIEHVPQPKGPPQIVIGVREKAKPAAGTGGNGGAIVGEDLKALSDADLDTKLGEFEIRLPHNTGREKKLARLAEAIEARKAAGR